MKYINQTAPIQMIVPESIEQRHDQKVVPFARLRVHNLWFLRGRAIKSSSRLWRDEQTLADNAQHYQPQNARAFVIHGRTTSSVAHLHGPLKTYLHRSKVSVLNFVQCIVLLGSLIFSQQNLAQTPKYDFTVAKDGSGNFKTVQEAFNAVPDFRKNTTTILLKSGTYKEKLILAGSKTNVRLVGEDALKTTITFDDYAKKKNKFDEEIGTTGSTTFFAFAEGFTAENITFENSSGPVGQAVAVRVDGDMTKFTNCRFLGFQDTLYPHGEKSRQYYKDCYIEGTVDYIFGWSTAVFENCTIHTKKGGLYVTAASTLETTPYGFVFINCKITGDAPDESVYLGRPWRPYAKTVFINCFLDKLIKPDGWHNWNKPDAEKTSFYAEYKSKGEGANDKARVAWSHQLTDEQVKDYSLEKIFGDWKVN